MSWARTTVWPAMLCPCTANYVGLTASSSLIVCAAALVHSAETLPAPMQITLVSADCQSASFFGATHNRHLPLQQVRSACPVCPAPSLQKCETDTLGNGRQLTYGDYRDASRALRRSLKQLGSGALEAGIRQLTVSEAAAEEVASLIGVNAQVRSLTHGPLWRLMHSWAAPLHQAGSGWSSCYWMLKHRQVVHKLSGMICVLLLKGPQAFSRSRGRSWQGSVQLGCTVVRYAGQSALHAGWTEGELLPRCKLPAPLVGMRRWHIISFPPQAPAVKELFAWTACCA